jgi:hypothetical protein
MNRSNKIKLLIESELNEFLMLPFLIPLLKAASFWMLSAGIASAASLAVTTIVNYVYKKVTTRNDVLESVFLRSYKFDKFDLDGLTDDKFSPSIVKIVKNKLNKDIYPTIIALQALSKIKKMASIRESKINGVVHIQAFDLETYNLLEKLMIKYSKFTIIKEVDMVQMYKNNINIDIPKLLF